MPAADARRALAERIVERVECAFTLNDAIMPTAGHHASAVNAVLSLLPHAAPDAEAEALAVAIAAASKEGA